jgi:hypothetical protein
MTPHPFDRQIVAAGRRLEALQQRAGESSGQGAFTLETLQELSAALEELHVASEELRHQNEELAASPTSNLGCYGSGGFVGLPCHSVTIARTQVFTGFMTSEGMRRVA